MADTIDSLRIENRELKEDRDFYKGRSERFWEQYTTVCEHREKIASGAYGLAEAYWASDIAKLTARVAELEAQQS
jgi:hypothetical protein